MALLEGWAADPALLQVPALLLPMRLFSRQAEAKSPWVALIRTVTGFTIGHSVTLAVHPADALAQLDGPARFTLLLTDVVMPGELTGVDLARQDLNHFVAGVALSARELVRSLELHLSGSDGR